MATWNGIEIVASIPRLWSASEFARQNPSGVYLHATCIQTAAIDLRVGMDTSYNPDSSQIGNILQAMVNEWRADNPNVSAGGASTYADAVEWLRDDLGFRVDANVAGPGWWNEINAGLRAGCGYLVGTCNAQALPGDEAGVQCHGYSAQALLADGRILCGDPDNAASQVLMPTNPVGHLVAYTEADMAAAGVLSLTKVWPKVGVPDKWTDSAGGDANNDSGTLSAPNGQSVVHGFRQFILTHAWDAGDQPLSGQTWAQIEYAPGGDPEQGAVQDFWYTRLAWTNARGVFRVAVGKDYHYVLGQWQQLKSQPAPAAQHLRLGTASATDTSITLPYSLGS